MKRVFKILLVSVMMVLCMSMMSFAQEKTEISNGDQLLDAFKQGGYGVLEKSITIDEIESVYSGKDLLIDLNGNSININSDQYTFNANVCFMNGEVAFFGNDLTIPVNTLAMKNGLLNLSQLNLRIGDKANLLTVGEGAYIVKGPKYYKTVIKTLSVDSGLISGEMLKNMVATGDLPELKKDGYSFDGWKDIMGNDVTNWKSDPHTDLIRATWSEKTASVFGGGSIWMILTIVFFISTVVLAVLYARKK